MMDVQRWPSRAMEILGFGRGFEKGLWFQALGFGLKA